MWDEAKDRSSDVAWGEEKLKARAGDHDEVLQEVTRNTRRRFASERRSTRAHLIKGVTWNYLKRV